MFHLPVRGNGDGGIYTTAADVHALWDALFAGRIVSPDTVAEMVRPRSDVPEMSMRYGLGFWLARLDRRRVAASAAMPASGSSPPTIAARRFTYTVLSNKTRGAWPVSQRLDQLLARIDLTTDGGSVIEDPTRHL